MKDDTIAIDGEIYISSRRAGKQFGYTSDYIGFLAREGKVKSRIIGRTRFVGQKSLANYKFSSENSKYQTRLESKLESKLEPKTISSFRRQEVSNFKNFNIVKGLVLAAILISIILPPLVSNLTDYVFNFDPGSVVNKKFLVASVQPRKEAESLPGFFLSSVQDTISKIKNESAKLDEKLFNYLNSSSGRITTFFDFLGSELAQLVKEVKTILAGKTEVIEVAVTGPSREPDLPRRQTGGQTTSTRPVNITVATDTLDKKGKQEIVYQVPVGLGIFPSTGDGAADRRLTRSIEESFSDEVAVRFDESGRTGIITPVFRARADDNYIFVLVPVKKKNDGL